MVGGVPRIGAVGMEQPDLDVMLDLHRFPSEPWVCLLLLLYSPIGLCLFLLRLFIGAHVFLVSCVLPESLIRRFLLRVMSWVLGVVVGESGRRDPSVKIYISNHRTNFDHNVISLITPCSSTSGSSPPGFLCWARGFLELGAPGSRSQLLESLKHYLSQPTSPPLLLFPEEETTNGRAGLLHFSSWPFSLSDCVQPLALRVTRPLMPPTVAGSSWLADLLWTLFLPYTAYHVRWMPTVCRDPRESDQNFAARVQKGVASVLGVWCTSHTALDQAEFVKRRVMDVSHRRMQPRPLPPTANESARRVKEVLPQVPLPVIHRDLALTGCVDTTITNILEGRVTYVPEAEPQTGNEIPGRGSDNPTRTSHKGFARRPEERHLSLQERKEALYEYARRRYLEKFRISGTGTEDSARG